MPSNSLNIEKYIEDLELQDVCIMLLLYHLLSIGDYRHAYLLKINHISKTPSSPLMDDVLACSLMTPAKS
jgi:hypothetical protein